MIVPMKKLSLLIYHKDYQTFLNDLREQGVVHIHENRKRSAEDEQLKEAMTTMKRIVERLRILEKRSKVDHAIEVKQSNGDLLTLLDTKLQRIEQINQQIGIAHKDMSLYEPWGELPRRAMEGINEAGWDLRFFIAPDKKYMPQWETDYNVIQVAQNKGQRYFAAVVHRGDEINIDAEEFQFPESSSHELEQQIQQLYSERDDINLYLDKIAESAVQKLKAYRVALTENVDMCKVNGAKESYVEDKIIALEGWIPQEIEKSTVDWLERQNAFFEVSEPTLKDNPPIKLKNNAFARLFEFIGELYALPNYRELDLTPYFSPFFLLFFGLCLGDAGYGLFIFVAVTLFKAKAKPSLKPILSLAQWLGFSTILMGIVSGTFFGIQLMNVQIPWIERLKIIMLDSQQLFNLALILGVIQIVFGMFIKVANLTRQYGFQSAVSTVGWLVLILGGGITYYLSTKGMDVTILTYVVLGIGGLLVLILNNVKRNIFINVGAGLWDTYNMVTGLMGDVLSYIRLFALGISSSVLGLVFNDLAMNMSGDIPVVSQIVMLLILLFGHGINIFIAGLGSFVHPMRLTFVEFYKNSGFEGGGKKYTPLKRRSI